MQYLKFATALVTAACSCGAVFAQQSPTTRDGPSFDCARVRSKIDKMICADTDLSSLDRKVAELFSLALTQTPDQGDVKRAHRRWLGDRDDCKSTECLKNRYEARLESLATFTGRLPSTFVRALCTRMETPQTRSETLDRTAGSEDVNNDGKPESATSCSGGAANVPCAAYLDESKRPIQIQPQGFTLDTYAPRGRRAFRYENRTFVYHSRDAALAEPAYLSYITPTNREFRICEFDTNVGSAVVEGSHEVCAAVESGEGIEPTEWTNAADRQSIPIGRANTVSGKIGGVDIDNDRLDEAVVELRYEGEGCVFNYFELLTEDRRALLGNSNNLPVRDLQGLPSEGYQGRNCGAVENRLFRFGDKVFYETNVANNPLVPHEVRVLDGTAVATLCTLERQVTVRVRKVF